MFRNLRKRMSSPRAHACARFQIIFRQGRNNEKNIYKTVLLQEKSYFWQNKNYFILQSQKTSERGGERGTLPRNRRVSFFSRTLTSGPESLCT